MSELPAYDPAASVDLQTVLALARRKLHEGDIGGARNFTLMVVERAPRLAAAWALLTRIAALAGDKQAMRDGIFETLRLDPGEPEALALRAALHFETGGAASALHDLERALQRTPDTAALHRDRATVLYHLQRHTDAVAALLTAIELDDSHIASINTLGTIYQELGQFDLAAACYLKATERNPNFALAHNNYGALMQACGELTSAEASFRRALALDGNYAIAWKNLGSLLLDQGCIEAAMEAMTEAMRCQPDYVEAQCGLVYAKLQACDWSNVDELRQRLLNNITQHSERGLPFKVSPFMFLGIADQPTLQNRVAQQWAAGCLPVGLSPGSGVYQAKPPGSATPRGRKLRLAYLGGDFFSHAMSRLTAGLFCAHDRAHFTVLGYDYSPPDHSELRGQIINCFDHYRDVRQLTYAALAEQLKADKVDIAIDLNGWTRRSRLPVFAYRPAPLQLHYLGFPGTLGASYCDYLVGDRILMPPGCEADYSEALIRLPHCYQINNRQPSAPPPRHVAGLPDHALVLCCFNQHYKITPDLFALWMTLLQAHPSAVLWLLDGGNGVKANLAHAAQQYGIHPDRLIYAPLVSQDAHLARLPLADLALDTLPYNSHTTASDALYAGVPLVTLIGTSFAARVGASCLTAVALSELIAHTPDEYLGLAMQLLNAPEKLARLKHHLLNQRNKLSLFDTQGTCRALEAAYLTVWERYEAGLLPESIELGNGD